MRISAITNCNSNIRYSNIKRQNLKKEETPPVVSNVNFKGARGTFVGGLVGLTLAVITSLNSPSLQNIFEGVLLASTGLCALLGHRIEEEYGDQYDD